MIVWHITKFLHSLQITVLRVFQCYQANDINALSHWAYTCCSN